LHHTPHAYIYASNAWAAGEADRLIGDVAGEFEKDTGIKPTKGLVLVTDERDALLPLDWSRYLKEISEDSGGESGGESLDGPAQELGISKEAFLRIIAFGMRRDEAMKLIELPEPLRTGPEWVVVMPTRATLAKMISQMMKAAFKKNDIGPVAQAMVAPLLAIMEPKMVDMVGMMRNVAVFSALVDNRQEWTQEQKKEKKEAYEQRKVKRAQDAFTASLPKPPATRPAETQPAEAAETRPAGERADTQPAETQPAATTQPATAPASEEAVGQS